MEESIVQREKKKAFLKVCNNEKFFIFFLFTVGVYFHYILGDFKKSVGIMPDEVYYYQIARSLANGMGVMERSLPSSFQKILYSIVLSPLFLIKDVTLRIKLINILNTLFVESSIFPIALLINKLDFDTDSKRLILILFLIFPETMCTATFMSENLYWPLCTWFIYLWYLCITYEKTRHYILLGIVGYLCYFTKEIALALIIAVVLEPIIQKIINKEKRNPIKNIIIFILVFVALYLILKFTIFYQRGENYPVDSISKLANHKKLGYFFYALFYYFLSITMTVLIFPIILPLANTKKIPEKIRRMERFLILTISISIFAIVYEISVGEDFGKVAPKIHLRYFQPVLFIIIAIFIYCLKNNILDFTDKKTIIVLAIVSVLEILFFKASYAGNNIQEYSLLYYFGFSRDFGTVFGSGFFYVYEGEDKPFYLGNMLFNAFLLLYLWLVVFLKKEKKNVLAEKIFILFLIIIFLISDYYSNIFNRWALSDSEEDIETMTEISDYFSDKKDEIVLYVIDDDSLFSNTMTVYTYLENPKMVIFSDIKDIKKLEQNKKIDIENVNFVEKNEKRRYEKVKEIDYIIMPSYNGRYLKNVEKVEELGGENYVVYKNLDEKHIYFEGE